MPQQRRAPPPVPEHSGPGEVSKARPAPAVHVLRGARPGGRGDQDGLGGRQHGGVFVLAAPGKEQGGPGTSAAGSVS